MKKLLILLLLPACAFLASCGRQQGAAEPTEPTTIYKIDAEALLDAEEVAHHDCSVHGHVFSEPTCQKVSTCFYCGEMQGGLGEHDWMHATCMQRATCTVCGLQNGDYAAHRFTTATCAGPASCVFCGTTSGSALAHQFRPATCVSPSMCANCMKKQGNPLGHMWTGGSCTQGQVCKRCNRTLPAPGHKMSAGSCTEDSVCSVCGYTVKAKGHQFVDTVCSVCGKTMFEAQQAEAARSTTLPSTEPESTLPAIDKTKLKQYGTSIREYLQTAHDEVDDAITKPGVEGRELALHATEELRKAQALIDEAKEFCKSDARLKQLSDTLSSAEQAIRTSASLTADDDLSSLNRLTKMRADCTAGLEAVQSYEKAIDKL